MSKVLVVEDDPTMSAMVAYNLRRQGLEVEVEAEGAAGLRKAKSRETSMVILDVMLPGLDGMQIAEQVRKARPTLPILMLTALGEEKDKLRGFSTGVDDYLTKPFSMDELVARVRALLRRLEVNVPGEQAPGEIVFGDLKLAPADLLCWVAGAEVALRPREFSLLATLASEPGRLFSRVQLGEKVWGYSHLGDTRTIDTHVKNVRQKVESKSAYTFIETVRGAGYRFRVRPKALE